MDLAASVFQFGAFSLDVGERVLLRDGRLVPLPAKVLSTLIILVRNNGHLVEKEFLMKEVWPDEVVEEGNLAQHIFMLRRTLGERYDQYVAYEVTARFAGAAKTYRALVLRDSVADQTARRRGAIPTSRVSHGLEKPNGIASIACRDVSPARA